MYRLILGNTKAYVMDYGEPLEAHGFVQKILLEEGLVGLGLFVGFFVYLVIRLGRSALARGGESFLYVMFTCLILGEVIFQLFNTSYFNSVLWLPVGMALAAIGLKDNSAV